MKLSTNCYNFAEQLLEDSSAKPDAWDLSSREAEIANLAVKAARGGGGPLAAILKKFEAGLSAMENAPRDDSGRQILNLTCEIDGIGHPR